MGDVANGPSSPLLDGISADEIRRFFKLGIRRSFRDADEIIAEGAAGDALFIVASGCVRVEKATIDQRQEVLTTLGPGECFGELSLVDRQPRSATVRAAGKTDVYVFPQVDLDGFFKANPEAHTRVLENLVKITSRRLRQLDETLVQGVYDRIVLVDRACRVLKWQRVTDEQGLLDGHIRPDETVGRNLFELIPFLGENIRKQVLHVMASGEMTTLHIDHRESDGKPVYFEVTLAPYRNRGQTSGAVVGVRNVTETRSLETQLMQAEKLALTGQMAAEIAHELNNYLAVISGHTDLLMIMPQIQQEEEAFKSLEAISDQVRKVEQFTEGLMGLGRLRVRKEKANLNLLVDRLVQFIQGQSRFRRIEFVLELDPGLPGLEVDPGQIQQVLLNLYVNAADAMDRGTITTSTCLLQAKNQVVVTVADNGPGMPEEVRQQIFETGFTTKPQGHGYGLAVSQRIVETHNGTISVVSEPGQGTTFTLTFQI